MPTYDHFDICIAHALIEYNWNIGGIVHERPSNIRRNMSTGFQLHRMHFKASPLFNWRYSGLTRNQKAIYNAICDRYGFERGK